MRDEAPRNFTLSHELYVAAYRVRKAINEGNPTGATLGRLTDLERELRFIAGAFGPKPPEFEKDEDLREQLQIPEVD